jgi:hypothetical protein
MSDPWKLMNSEVGASRWSYHQQQGAEMRENLGDFEEEIELLDFLQKKKKKRRRESTS